MIDYINKISETADFLKGKGYTDASFAIVLGSGLGRFVDKMEIISQLSYSEIPHFPISTVEFHKGNLLLGLIGEKKVIAMQGRFHYYEGYTMQEITFPIRVMKLLGAQQLLLSNAAGGINPDFKKGDLAVIEDHINLLPENPLRGLFDPAFGNRFVDMSEPYDKNLNQLLFEHAEQLNIKLKKGVYASVMGPNLETKAEYRYIANIGADMVGMSTIPEVIVANHIGLKCAAVSVITDECDPANLKPVDIAEIIKVAGEADGILSELFEKVIKNK
jgi:purine-nucleoside phosphorylase